MILKAIKAEPLQIWRRLGKINVKSHNHCEEVNRSKKTHFDILQTQTKTKWLILPKQTLSSKSQLLVGWARVEFSFKFQYPKIVIQSIQNYFPLVVDSLPIENFFFVEVNPQIIRGQAVFNFTSSLSSTPFFVESLARPSKSSPNYGSELCNDIKLFCRTRKSERRRIFNFVRSHLSGVQAHTRSLLLSDSDLYTFIWGKNCSFESAIFSKYMRNICLFY